MYQIKSENVYEDFISYKEMFGFNNDDSNKLIVGKMKDEIGGVVIEGFVGLKSKMYSVLVDDSEHKKAKGVNKNVVVTIRHN